VDLVVMHHVISIIALVIADVATKIFGKLGRGKMNFSVQQQIRFAIERSAAQVTVES